MRARALLAAGALGLAIAGLSTVPASANALSALAKIPTTNTGVTKIADGCGAGRYRGPGGWCHRFGTGPYPGGYYGPRRRPYGWRAGRRCWRGPYGGWRCRW